MNNPHNRPRPHNIPHNKPQQPRRNPNANRHNPNTPHNHNYPYANQQRPQPVRPQPSKTVAPKNQRQKPNYQNPKNKPLKYKTSTSHKIANAAVLFLCLIFIIVGSISIYAHDMMNNMFSSQKDVSINFDALPSLNSGSTDTASAQITDKLIKDPMVLNIALFGSDVRPGEVEMGNSDTIVLVSIDNRHQKIKLTSFMRDTWVSIPKVNYSGKLNAAYAAGGPVLALETIERNFGVDIDRYAVVDFETFPSIIDAIGGIELTITKEEAAYLHHDFPYRTPSFSKGAGTYHLNGQEALDHARNRHVGFYDFERTQRQRDVLMAMVNKIKDSKDVSVFVNLMVDFLPGVTTNISVDEMANLAKNALEYAKYPISQFRVPTDDNYKNKEDPTWGSVLVIDNINKAREDLARFIYEETADKLYGSTSSKLPDISLSSSSSSSYQ